MTEENSGTPHIVHISSDYMDGLGDKSAHRHRHPTVAINNLVEGAQDFDHTVFSLRRRSLPIGLFLTDLGTPRRANVRVFAYAHYGLPLGIGLFHSFWLVARTIRRVLQERNIQPHAIHAHRLTFEGIAGWLLARSLDVPLFISVRGEVDSKVFRFKPSYRHLMRRIVSRAVDIFFVSAWYATVLKKYAFIDPCRAHLLPNIVGEMAPPETSTSSRTTFLTVANLSIWKKKGLDRLLRAIAISREHTNLRLQIIGGGTPESITKLRRLIERLGLEDRVSLAGPLPNAEVRKRMSEAIAVALPSHNETFGLVYVEALFAGTPILYSKGTGIDGFLNDLEVGIAVDPTDEVDIARALVDLASRNDRYRANVVANADRLENRFGRKQVLARYQDSIRGVLGEHRSKLRSHCEGDPTNIYRRFPEQIHTTTLKPYDRYSKW
jgi:glycosyltransferase involved in cell wall biosynthesis